MKVLLKSWQCNSCGHKFQFNGYPAGAHCPMCNGKWLTRLFNVKDNLSLGFSDHIVLKGKDSRLPSKRKLRREVRNGIRPEGSGSGRLVKERRIIDADSDEYEERIVDIASGLVLREISEPLSKHRGGLEKYPKK